MRGRCKLCGDPLDGGDMYCQCGQHLHTGCHQDHRAGCPAGGTEGWIGTFEF